MAAKSTTTTVTAKQVSTGLSRTSEVTAEEERALRMRFGAKAEPRAPLPRKAEPNTEAADGLLLRERQLLRAYGAHLAAQGRPLTAAKPAPTVSNRSKDKIVRALRKKR